MKAEQISDYISSELDSDKFTEEDYSLNGLQVDFSDSIKKITASVDVGLSTIENCNSDLIIAHHGIFWKKQTLEAQYLKRIYEASLNKKISVIAQHLPLDSCPKYGNNFSLAKVIELENIKASAKLGSHFVGSIGDNSKQFSLEQIIEKLKEQITSLSKSSTNIYSLNFGPKKPNRISIVSGSGCDQLYNYNTENFDTLITGEPRQFIYHYCKDHKLNVICAGHYATEMLGVINLAKLVADKYDLEWEFFDMPTGI